MLRDVIQLVAYLLDGVPTLGVHFTRVLGFDLVLEYYVSWILGLAAIASGVGVAVAFWSCLHRLSMGWDRLRAHPVGRVPAGLHLEREHLTWRHDIAYHWLPWATQICVWFGLPVLIGRVGCHLLPIPTCGSHLVSGYVWMFGATTVMAVTILGSWCVYGVSDWLGDWVAGWPGVVW